MRDKRKTIDKKAENLKFKKLAKKQKMQERGITLIALVVTIIILLILSGVTLNIALSDDGLFSKTKKATEDYKEAQSDEEDSIRQISTQLYSEYVGATVEGYSPSDEEREVTIDGTTSGVGSSNDDGNGNKIDGVEVNGSQKIKADTEIKWRVWDFDGNTLRIIGEPTNSLTLKGAAGYNNGVWAIDNICKTLYSNEEKGAIATNLKRTDIQKVSTYDYTKFKHKTNDWKEDTTDDDENSIYFGESKTYETDNQYPNMWDDNDKDWTYGYDNTNKTETGRDKECKKWEVIGTKDGKMEGTMSQGSYDTTFKQSFYHHNYSKKEFINDKYYDLIFKKDDGSGIAETYWLAGRCVLLYKGHCDFGLQYVNASGSDSILGGLSLCISSNR